MMAMLVLFSGFAAVIVVGSILVAINDAIEGVVERRRNAARTHVRTHRPARPIGKRPGLSTPG